MSSTRTAVTAAACYWGCTNIQSNRALLVLSFLLSSGLCHAGFPEEVTPFLGFGLGRGYDLTTGEAKNDCVVFNPPTSFNVPVNFETFLDTVEDKSELAQQMEVGLSAAVNAGGVGASGSLGLFNSSSVESFSSTFIARVSVDMGQWSVLTNAALKSEFVNLDPTEFRRKCGNSFVLATIGGGEFVGIGSVRTLSTSDQAGVSAELAASYGPVSAGGSFSSGMAQLNSEGRVTVKTFVQGGLSGATNTLDGIAQKVTQFPSEVQATGGVIKSVMIQTYNILANYNYTEDSSTGPTLPSALLDLGDRLWKLETLREDVLFVKANPTQFYQGAGWVSSTSAGLIAKIDFQTLLVTEAIKNCRNSYGQNCKPNPRRVPPGGAYPAGQSARPTFVAPEFTSTSALRTFMPLRYTGVCQNLTLQLPSLTVFPLEHVTGDTDMAGHNPKITVDSKLLDHERRYLRLETKVKMREAIPDRTTFTGYALDQVFDIQANNIGCVLGTPWASPRTGSLSAHGGTDNHEWSTYYGSQLIKTARCRSDTHGDETGKIGCNPIKFWPTTILLEHEEDSLSAAARRQRRDAQNGGAAQAIVAMAAERSAPQARKARILKHLEDKTQLLTKASLPRR
jgi:hypothetical protein